ncbi:hypothetical protein TWF281_002761 [Arthrobotrys megalospora]
MAKESPSKVTATKPSTKVKTDKVTKTKATSRTRGTAQSAAAIYFEEKANERCERRKQLEEKFGREYLELAKAAMERQGMARKIPKGRARQSLAGAERSRARAAAAAAAATEAAANTPIGAEPTQDPGPSNGRPDAALTIPTVPTAPRGKKRKAPTPEPPAPTDAWPPIPKGKIKRPKECFKGKPIWVFWQKGSPNRPPNRREQLYHTGSHKQWVPLPTDTPWRGWWYPQGERGLIRYRYVD